MRAAIIKLLKRRGPAGYSKRELAKQLGIDPGQRREMRKMVSELVSAGELKVGAKGRIIIGDKAAPEVNKPARRGGSHKEAMTGVYRQHPNGFGWFYPDAASTEAHGLSSSARIKIPERERLTAIDGDTVSAIMRAPREEPVWKQKRAEARAKRGKAKPANEKFADDILGKVVDIVQRREGPIIGRFADGKSPALRPDDDSIPRMQLIDTMDAVGGQVVAVELVKWDSPTSRPVGKVVEIIGWPDSAGVDIMSVIKRHNLPMDFPEAVVAEAQAQPAQLSDAEIKRRKDYRSLPIVTVDPFDARDHDDACFVEKLDGGGYRLHVHIADVAHFVRPGTELDKEARKRGNSTYLVDRVMPMLPKVLSNGLCSITPDDDTATKCCIIDYDSSGKVKVSRFVDAVMRSRARLSYEEAQEMIDGKGEGEIPEVIRTSWELADILRRNRFAEGALDMEFAETKILIDDQGVPTDIILNEHTPSHQMIEEFMLAANEQAAKALKNKRQVAIYRIHEDPDADRLLDFAETARAHGYQPGDLTNREHVQKLLTAAKGKATEHAIKLGLLKSLKRAVYAVEPLGHYGLNKADYCHFTSPIRRYADLVVHRALEGIIENPPTGKSRTPKQGEAMDIAKHISTTERRSAEAEIETKRMKQIEYLWRKLEAGEPPIYEAIVTDVRRMGLFIEVDSIQQRGVIKREDLPRGRWTLDSGNMQLVGPKGRAFKLGQTIKAKVARVDREQYHVDFRFVESEGA